MKTLHAAVVIGAVLSVSGAVARGANQPYFHAGWKMLGAEAVMGQQHAQDRAQTLYYYNQIPKTVPKSHDDAKALVAGIKKDLGDADTALDKLKVEVAKNKEAVALIDSIKKHHAKAHEVCGMAEEICMKHHEGEDAALGDCCSDMWHEIDAAKADTAKLLKLLKIDKLEPPKKAEVTKAAAKK